MQPLLRSKLSPPLEGPTLVFRTRLEEKGEVDPRIKLILVHAPAGFGKTTLMARWWARSREAGRHTGWLTLDEGDNDLGRFTAYLARALEGRDPASTSTSPSDGCEGRERPSAGAALGLVDRVGEFAGRFSLFLDDFERIRNPEVLSLLRQVIEALPPGGLLVLGSRKAPELGLARLRAQGQLMELGVETLRFFPEETEQFLRGLHGLCLGSEDLSRLHRCSEGWIAGLQLFTLALASAVDRDAFIQRLSGSFSDVADYLAEEVLANQPEEVRTFLLRTSVTERLTGSLCDALTGRTDGEEMLRQVERANLFLLPLDHERRWYRYHMLFAEFLRERLDRGARGEVPGLHRAAAAWYEEHEQPVEAVRHALLGGDSESAARLMTQCGHLLVTRFGQVGTVIDWVGHLPPHAVAGRPRLQLAYGWALCFLHRYRDAEAILDQIAGAPGVLDEGARKEAAALRIAIPLYADRVAEAHRLTEENLASVGSGSEFLFGVLANVLAYCLTAAGDFERARDLLARSRRSHVLAGSEFGAVYAECFEGLGRLAQGQLRAAISSYRAALARARELGPGYSLPIAFAASFLAEALYEGDELPEAERLLAPHVALFKECGVLDAVALGYRTLARIQLRRGSAREAGELLDELEQIARERGAERLVATVGLERVRAALWREDVDGAEEVWRRSQKPELWKAYEPYCMPANDPETPRLARLRLWVRAGRARDAARELRAELARATAAGRGRQALLARVLLATALDAVAERRVALRVLREAVQGAQAEGQIRSFLDEGPAVIHLLSELREASLSAGESSADGGAPALLDRVLQAAGAPRPTAALGGDGGPLEALSPREVSLLALLSHGLTNQALADRLCISETTVRYHLRKIHTKLGAHNRTEAVALARRHGFIA